MQGSSPDHRAQGFVRPRCTLLAICCLMVVLLRAGSGYAQYYNPNDERFKLLALEKAELNLRDARRQMLSTQQLFERNLVAADEIHRVEVAYGRAKIEYQQALLSVVFERPYVLVESAVKYEREDGRKGVRLTLVNRASGLLDIDKLEVSDSLYPIDKVELYTLRNAYVSLRHNGSIVSQPYEHYIDRMALDKPVEVDFLLLKDLDEVTVSFTCGNQTDEKLITLMRDSRAGLVSVRAPHFSNDAELGGRVTYQLALEQFAETGDSYGLLIVNLPAGITCEIRDPKTGSRVSQVKFDKEGTGNELELTLFMPDRVQNEIAVDMPIRFWVLVVPSQHELALAGVTRPQLTELAIDSIHCGKAKLEVIPRGTAKLALVVDQFYHSIEVEDTLRIGVRIRNDGSIMVGRIEPQWQMPTGWQGEIEPNVIDHLAPGEESVVTFVCRPPANAVVGEYELVVKAEARVNNRIVEDEKNVRVHLESPTSYLAMVTVSVLLIALLVAVVAIGVRLSKR